MTTSKLVQEELEKYSVPVVCIDDIPYVWKWQGKRFHRIHEYISLDSKFKKTSEYLNAHANIVIFYELFEFSKSVELTKPKKVFLTHGNMLKNYLMMYPRRLEIIKTYDYMAALGPFMKHEFLNSGIEPEKLVDIGIARTDEVVALRGKVILSDKLISIGVSPDKPVVSYLPTFWGDSSVEKLGPTMLERITSEYTVLFRPHPQTPRRILKQYENIIAAKKNIFYIPEKGPNNPSLLEIFAASSVTIGDLSSVMLEAILLDKPLIFAEPDTSSNTTPHTQIDDIVECSQLITIENVENINRIIHTTIREGIDRRVWEKAKNRCFYCYKGNSVSSITDFIVSII